MTIPLNTTISLNPTFPLDLIFLLSLTIQVYQFSSLHLLLSFFTFILSFFYSSDLFNSNQVYKSYFMIVYFRDISTKKNSNFVYNGPINCILHFFVSLKGLIFVIFYRCGFRMYLPFYLGTRFAKLGTFDSEV